MAENLGNKHTNHHLLCIFKYYVHQSDTMDYFQGNEVQHICQFSSKLYIIYKKKGNKEKSSVVFYKALRVSPPDLYRVRSVSGYLAVLLNKILLLVFTGSARRIRLAAEGELVAVFRLSCFYFLVPICFFPAAYESGHHCQCG